MEPERWRRLEEIFFAGLDLDAAGRAGVLAEARGADPELAQEAAAMLAAHDSGEPQGIERFLLPGAGGAGGPDARRGARVGAYRLIERIGQGGMGEVYLAERADGHFEQRVAVKLLRTGFAGDEAIARFRTEREILARLEHPHIARLLDGGLTEEGLPFLAMEHVRGDPITRFCEAGKTPLEDRLRLFLDVCRAVHFAHQNLVVHRDLKPSNILVTDRGEAKLLDFGIAKLLAEGAEAATRTGLLPLTPEYASPEQVRGGGITTATDVYALGLLLHEILTGQRAQPIADLSPVNVQRVVCDGEPARPSAAAPERLARRLRGDLDTIVATALHKDPARRYASAEALAADIERHLSGLPIQARGDSLGYRTGKLLRRHRLAAAASAAVVAALLIGLLFAVSGLVRARRAEAEARREAETSRQISELLIGIFEVSDPGEAHGETVTARELLDRGAERVRTQLAAQPAVQANLLRTMGRVYSKLGLFARAQSLFESDLAARRALRGPGHPEVAASLTLLAEVANHRGEPTRARELGRQALTMLERTPGSEPLATARTLNALGVASGQLGDRSAAKSLLERSLAMYEKALGPSHPDLVGVLNNLAILRWQARDFAGARPLYERALALLERRHGKRHPEVASTLNNLALIDLESGSLQQARALQEQALGIRRALLAPDHPDIAESLNNLGTVMLRQGDLERARSAFGQSLAIRERALGPAHPLVAATLYNLGLTLAKLGSPEQARPLLERSVALFSRTLGPRHPDLSFPLQTLAEIGLHTGNLAAAERTSARMLALRWDESSAQNPTLDEARKLRARILRTLGRNREAEALETLAHR